MCSRLVNRFSFNVLVLSDLGDERLHGLSLINRLMQPEKYSELEVIVTVLELMVLKARLIGYGEYVNR